MCIAIMSETCIVCLGDLAEGANNLPLPLVEALEAGQQDASRDGAFLQHGAAVAQIRFEVKQADLIAHLLPCGHNLHDECLKPWVERANSCPICRQNFNQVDLSAHIGGGYLLKRAVTDIADTTCRSSSLVICCGRPDPNSRYRPFNGDRRIR